MNQVTLEKLMYYAEMFGCNQTLPPEQRGALEVWEKQHVDGSGKYRTSDWPGWEKYIGKKPKFSQRKIDKSGFVYVISCAETAFKIGISKNVQNRLAALQTGNPLNLTLIHSFPAEDAISTETKLHQMFDCKRVLNEWFQLSQTDVEFLKSLESDAAL